MSSTTTRAPSPSSRRAAASVAASVSAPSGTGKIARVNAPAQVQAARRLGHAAVGRIGRRGRKAARRPAVTPVRVGAMIAAASRSSASWAAAAASAFAFDLVGRAPVGAEQRLGLDE